MVTVQNHITADVKTESFPTCPRSLDYAETFYGHNIKIKIFGFWRSGFFFRAHILDEFGGCHDVLHSVQLHVLVPAPLIFE